MGWGRWLWVARCSRRCRAFSRRRHPSRSAPSFDGDHIRLDKFSERLNFGWLQVLIRAGRGRPAMSTSHLSPGFGRGSFDHMASPRSNAARTRRRAPGRWCVEAAGQALRVGPTPAPCHRPGRSTIHLFADFRPDDGAGANTSTRGDGKTGMADWRSSPNTQDPRPRLHNRERIRILARRRKSDSSYGSIRGETSPGASDAPKPAPCCKERPPRLEQRPGRQPRTSISSCTPWASNKFSQRPETEPRRGKKRPTPCRGSQPAPRHCDDCIGRWRAGISRHARPTRRPRIIDPGMSAPSRPAVTVEFTVTD